MLISIASLALTLLAMIGAGSLFYSRAKNNLKDVAVLAIGGVFLISAVAMLFSFVIPLGGFVFQSIMAVFVAMGVRALWSRRSGFQKGEAAAAAVLFMACAVLGNRGWMHIDSGGYHNQMVKWLIESPIPFGLGNMHSRYAFNSVWHTFSAAMAFPGLGISGSYASGAALAWVLVFFVRQRLRSDQGAQSFSRYAFAWTVFSAITIVHAGRRVIETQIGSPSTDFPVAAFILLFLFACLDTEADSLEPGPLGFERSMIILAPLVLAVATKLSVVPIALAAVLFLRRLSKPALALSIAFGLVWSFRTYLLSGCFVYPMVSSCFLPASWSMPISVVDGEYQSLHIWGRVTPPPSDPAIIHSWFLWIPLWAKQAFTEDLAIAWTRFSAFATVLGAAGLLYAKGRWANRPSKAFLGLGFASFVALAFWFFQAPALRYAFGQIIATGAFLVSLSILATTGLANRLFSPVWRKRWASLCFCVFCAQALYNAKGIKVSHLKERWPKFPEVETIPVATRSGNTMSAPKKDGLCWNASLEARCSPTSPTDVREAQIFGRPEFLKD